MTLLRRTLSRSWEQRSRRKWHNVWFCSCSGFSTCRPQDFPIRLISVSGFGASVTFEGFFFHFFSFLLLFFFLHGGIKYYFLYIHSWEIGAERSAQWYRLTWFYRSFTRKSAKISVDQSDTNASADHKIAWTQDKYVKRTRYGEKKRSVSRFIFKDIQSFCVYVLCSKI